MTHGDDSGLILPPRVAPYQVVIVPIPRGNWQETVLPKAQEIQAELAAHGVRVMLDDRDAHTPGWKFAEWEMRGVPLRLEIGPKDIEKSQVVLARRDTREKAADRRWTGWPPASRALLDEIQAALLRPRAARSARSTRRAWRRYDEFKAVMEGRPASSSPAGAAAPSARRRSRPRRRRRCATFRSAASASTGTCVKCGKPSAGEAWFAKAY